MHARNREEMERATDAEEFLKLFGRVFSRAQGHRRNEASIRFVSFGDTETEGGLEFTAEAAGKGDEGVTAPFGKQREPVPFADLETAKGTGLAKIKRPSIESARGRCPLEREKLAGELNLRTVSEIRGQFLNPDRDPVIAGDDMAPNFDGIDLHCRRDRARPVDDRVSDPTLSPDLDDLSLPESRGEGK